MKKEYYFESGSSALIFSLLSEKKNSQIVFLPEFICNSLVERLNENKIRIDYYKIKKNLTTDWINLKNKIRKYNNKIIYILYVNYFGKINDRDNFINIKLNFRGSNKIKLIEDNSHGHYLNVDKNLKNKIDISFSSPTKIFSELYSGGILYREKFIDESKYKNLNILKVKIIILFKLFLKNFIIKYKFYFFLRELLSNIKINIKKKNVIQKIDNYSFQTLKKININKSLRLKVKKINFIDEKLKQFKFKKYFEFNDNLPWYYVCFTKNLKIKKKIQLFCKKEKILFFNWPKLPVENKNKRTKYIYDRIICIPLK